MAVTLPINRCIITVVWQRKLLLFHTINYHEGTANRSLQYPRYDFRTDASNGNDVRGNYKYDQRRKSKSFLQIYEKAK